MKNLKKIIIHLEIFMKWLRKFLQELKEVHIITLEMLKIAVKPYPLSIKDKRRFIILTRKLYAYGYLGLINFNIAFSVLQFATIFWKYVLPITLWILNFILWIFYGFILLFLILLDLFLRFIKKLFDYIYKKLKKFYEKFFGNSKKK